MATPADRRARVPEKAKRNYVKIPLPQQGDTAKNHGLPTSGDSQKSRPERPNSDICDKL
jgi:hypothetical protein